MVSPCLFFRVKELKEKDQSRRSKRELILFSKRDQEISDLVMTFSQEETLPDSSSGQSTSHSKDKNEFC